MKITYLGHASFLIESKDGDVVFDPYLKDSVPGLDFPKNISADACFCSHDHYDHIGKENVKIKAAPKKINYSLYKIPHDKDGGRKRGMNNICSCLLEGKQIVHLGDIGIVDKKILENIKNCDVLFVPINGFFTISAKEAKELYDFVQPKLIVPMHYEIKSRGIGYPDGGQIAEFIKYFLDNLKVKNCSVNLDDYLGKTECIIFEEILDN